MAREFSLEYEHLSEVSWTEEPQWLHIQTKPFHSRDMAVKMVQMMQRYTTDKYRNFTLVTRESIS